jgi:hypothetical protein
LGKFSAALCLIDLWSFDLFVFDLPAAVVSRTLAVVGFFNFMTWLGHNRLLDIECFSEIFDLKG